MAVITIKLMYAGVTAFIILLSGCTKKSPALPADNPAQYTTAEPVSLAGCQNCYKVSDTFYRGAQPTEKGMQELEKLGIKTIINLRSLHSDRDEMEGTGLKYIHIRMEAWDPKMDEVREFLRAATKPDNQPVFVHCLHGADRTGTMTAVYRMVIDGWSRKRAIDEMVEGPFGFHEIFDGLPEFLSDLDIETLQQEFAQAK